MANLKSRIKILRGTNTKISESSDILDSGQLLYNKEKNYLTVGDGSKGVNALPITVRSVKGNINDYLAISTDTSESNIYEFNGNENGSYIKTCKDFNIKNLNDFNLITVKANDALPTTYVYSKLNVTGASYINDLTTQYIKNGDDLALDFSESDRISLSQYYQSNPTMGGSYSPLLTISTSSITSVMPYISWYRYLERSETDVSATFSYGQYYKFTGTLTSFKPKLATYTNEVMYGGINRRNYCDWYIFEFTKTSSLSTSNILITDKYGEAIPFANGWTQGDFTNGTYVIYVLRDIAYVNYI